MSSGWFVCLFVCLFVTVGKQTLTKCKRLYLVCKTCLSIDTEYRFPLVLTTAAVNITEIIKLAAQVVKTEGIL